jgi:hypothetical protein
MQKWTLMSQGTFSHTQLERPIQAYCSLMELIKKIVCRCSVPEISGFGMVLFFSSYFWTPRDHLHRVHQTGLRAVQ